ncbi:MAG: hypothetical protein K9J06_15980, partial [Flavobacteriales bacterium]|nr:hypothetical protein [Flavobacteriales bacterium]
FPTLSQCQGGCTATGKVIVWIDSDFGCGNISVQLLGQTRTITNYSTSGTPPCGTSGFANFTNVPVGTHAWTATCTQWTWSGYNVTVSNQGQCVSIKLSL